MSPSLRLARHSGVIQTVAALIGCSILVLVTAGCGQAIFPSRPTTTQATSFAAPALADLPLDASSRDLLAVMDPAETALVLVGTTWTDELSRAALGAGMRVEIFEPSVSIAIDGPVGQVLALVGSAPVTSVTVHDPVAAMRPIPDERPTVEVPTPGRPYLLTGFVGDLSQVKIGSPQREVMLVSLAEAIQTIDGQPYAGLHLEGSCGSDKTGSSCGLIAVGLTSGSVGREDEWSLQATAQTGLGGAIASVRTTSVPRPLLRAAEWSARHDEAALARIRAFAECCQVSWDPAQPAQITLVYDRPCASALRPGQDLADTGLCRDELSITVDIRSGAIVSIEDPAGP